MKKVKTYLDVRFDVTDLSEEERSALALEVVVQAEASDFVGEDEHGWVGHRGVADPEIEYNEVEVEEGPVYGWMGWESGDELDPPEPDKEWLTITEDGEEMAVIVHRHTGRDDGEQMIKKVRRAQWIVEALNRAAGHEERGNWCVGKVGGDRMVRFSTYGDAMAAIEGIELVDPLGVERGMYFIDPPGNEDEGPGESSIYSGGAASETDQGEPEPGAVTERFETDYVLTVCLDGVPEGRDFHAIEEAIEATGEAMCRYEENPTKVVTLLLSENRSEYRAGQNPREVLTAGQAMYILFGYQMDEHDFDARTAEFRSGSDVCESLASHINLNDDEINAIARARRAR